MFAKTFSALAIVSAAAVVAQDSGMTVATPPVANQCQPLQITWKGGQAPYFPRITAPGNPSEVVDGLDKYQNTQDTKISGWPVSVPQGQKFTIYVCDSSGACNGSAPITVGAGSDSCLNGQSGGGGAAGGAAGGSSSKSSGDNNSSSKSSGDNSSSSQQSSSQSSSQQSSSSSKPTSSSGAGAAAGGASSSAAGGASSVASQATNGAATFSGVPAVVAGVVGAVVAALI
ncbi:hypothetical protein ACI68E_000290 [Malassezia pachydermatis]|uniref:Uncharacterized protein n=1 Tax=Malassezia pachydermatis TaxID=77020 RepID=A0A0M8MRU6_9BASI|nr:hypothetical protein Malapachy_2136 [Malassezia pachydermatis]KOS15507.1 hypothetical protein Malapachy_2136 [Malassezia pachydermatis]